MRVEIINGDHIPPHPVVIVNGHGLQVDFSDVKGELWDSTVSKIEWGIVHPGDGKIFGRVTLKNGQGRVFHDPMAIQPYLVAYMHRKLEEDAKHAANVKARQDEQARAMAKRLVDEDMVRAARAQAEQDRGQ